MTTPIRAICAILFTVIVLVPSRASAVLFAELACDSRCLTQYKSCASAQNHPGGNVYVCEDQYYECKFGCTGAIDSFSSGIDATASLLDGGRRIVVTGHVLCPAGETYRILSASAIQDAAIAVSNRPFVAICTGEPQGWELVIVARGADAFDAGPVHACAAGEVYGDGVLLAARQWCIDATLE